MKPVIAKTVRMNKTEAKYGRYLDTLLNDGKILDFRYEPFSIRLAEEKCFYHPDFFADLLRKTKDEIVGVAIVIEIPKSNNVNSYLIRNWRFLKFSEMAILAWRKYTMLFKNFFLVKSIKS